jgi:hypothetical protein
MTIKINNTGKDRLIHTFDIYCRDGDDLLVTATYVEDQMLESGATPGKDYNLLDCFKLAVEMQKVCAMEKLSKNYSN